MHYQRTVNPDLSALYTGLFAADGAEVCLRPAEWYVTLDTPVDFYTVAAGAAKRGETAIGYRDMTPTGAGDGQAAIHVNPPKADRHAYPGGDRVIVFAEDSAARRTPLPLTQSRVIPVSVANPDRVHWHPSRCRVDFRDARVTQRTERRVPPWDGNS